MKLHETRRSGRGDIGFIDPYVVNDHNLHHKLYAEQTRRNIHMFMKKQFHCNEILFPYRFE